MKNISTVIIVTCFLSTLVLGGLYYQAESGTPAEGPLGSNIDQAPHDAGFGSDAARIDSQITFKIPEGQADALYQYLRTKYFPEKIVTMEQFPGVRLIGQEMSDVSVFTDQYFDTPNLDLYKNTNSARYRLRINTTDSHDRKSGRELIQIKVTPPGQFDLRNELKYKLSRSAQYQMRDGRLPFVRYVSGGKRADFIEVFAKAGIDANTLRHILTITQTRSRVYVNWDKKNIVSFSVDQGEARILWAKGKFASVDVGLVEKTYTEADESKRKIMWQIRTAMAEDLKKQFPGLTVTSDSKYGIVLGQIIKKIGYIPTLLEFGIL
jgi:hypothetical protein